MNRRIHIDMQVRLPRSPVTEGSGSNNEEPRNRQQAARACGTSAVPQLKTYGSRELFDGLREVGIEHGGALYRLKITRQGKLILNK